MIFNLVGKGGGADVVPVSMAVTGSWSHEQLVGQAPDTTGLTFTVTYQTKQVTPSVSPATYSSTGSQTVTFSYTENGTTVTASKTATVIRKPVSLSVSGSWSKTQYVGSAMDTTGLTFTVTYNNGSTATVTPTKSPSTWTSSGTQTATFTYTENGTTVSTTKTATVVAVALSSIAVSGSWTNTQYTETAVDTTGLTVTATFNNGTTSDVTSSATVSPSTWGSTAGTQTATFSYTYNGVTKTTTKTATVEAIALSSIAVSGSWTNTQYTDTAPDITGLSFTATFNNGTTSAVSPSNISVSPATWSSTAGTQTATFSYTFNGVTKTATKTATVAKQEVYGVEWDGTSTTLLSRTDDSASFTNPNPYYSGMSGSPSSPFDNIAPWSEMTAVEDSEAGTLIKIPKFYYKWTRTGDAMKLQISSTQFTGSLVSPAHADRGDGKGERDVVYVGKYHCSNTDYKSTTGIAQKVSITRSRARSSISALGSTIWQWDYAMVWTIRMLYLVEYANWDSQATIGYGCCRGGSKENNGQTDSISYHTGTTAPVRASYGFTKYRNIEGLWDNVYDWCDGIYYNSSGVKIIKKPASFSDSSGGTVVATIPSTFSGEVKSWTNPTASGMEYALTPASSYSDSNYTTYIADSGYVKASYPCVYVGGYDTKYRSCGLFYAGCAGPTSYTNSSIGSRVQKLP